MKVLKKIILLFTLSLIIFSCEHENENETTDLQDKSSFKINQNRMQNQPPWINEDGQIVNAIEGEEIQLDYHDQYGIINIKDYPVGRGFTLEDFLEGLELTEKDLDGYQIIQANYTGIAVAEHSVDGEIIYVGHQYNEEPSYLFEAKLLNGNRISVYRISWCGNDYRPWYERTEPLDFFWAYIDYGCWWC